VTAISDFILQSQGVSEGLTRVQRWPKTDQDLTKTLFPFEKHVQQDSNKTAMKTRISSDDDIKLAISDSQSELCDELPLLARGRAFLRMEVVFVLSVELVSARWARLVHLPLVKRIQVFCTSSIFPKCAIASFNSTIKCLIIDIHMGVETRLKWKGLLAHGTSEERRR
jgi:hypothetical protein